MKQQYTEEVPDTMLVIIRKKNTQKSAELLLKFEFKITFIKYIYLFPLLAYDWLIQYSRFIFNNVIAIMMQTYHRRFCCMRTIIRTNIKLIFVLANVR